MINLSTWQKEFDPFGVYDIEVARDISNLILDSSYFLHGDNLKTRQQYKQMLLSLLPIKFDSISYAVSGSEALEHAILITSKKTGKKEIMVFDGCYHGCSSKMISIAYPQYAEYSTEQQNIFFRLPPPYCYRCQFKTDCDPENMACLKHIQESIEQRRDTLGGILIDPSFGNILLNENIPFFKGVRQLCDDYNICLIFDETRTAFGRKGELCSFMSLGIVPDIVVLNKSLACGIPLALTIYNRDGISRKDEEELLIRETTFSGNKITLGISSIVFRHFTNRFDKQLYVQKTQRMVVGLNGLYAFSKVGDVRNFGNMYAIEIVGANNKSDRIVAVYILKQLYKEFGIYINPPNYKSIILLYPMPTISEEEIDNVINSFATILYRMSDRHHNIF